MWNVIYNKIPAIEPKYTELFNKFAVYNNKIKIQQIIKISKLLKKFSPWKKGPFFLYGIYIDTEWDCHYKWNRIKKFISPLKNRLVLDVGCNNGYYMWRMIGSGANTVIGLDPTYLFLYQFESIKKLLFFNYKIYFLPLKIEHLPPTKAFDTVFSMGVLYHQKSPIDHILKLKNQLKINGELVLETLVIPGDENTILFPEKNFANMYNVWFITSTLLLIIWLKKCGFKHIRVINCTMITFNEQKKTEWVKKSFFKFLNLKKSKKTLEGYPSPYRVILIAKI